MTKLGMGWETCSRKNTVWDGCRTEGKMDRDWIGNLRAGYTTSTLGANNRNKMQKITRQRRMLAPRCYRWVDRISPGGLKYRAP